MSPLRIVVASEMLVLHKDIRDRPLTRHGVQLLLDGSALRMLINLVNDYISSRRIIRIIIECLKQILGLCTVGAVGLGPNNHVMQVIFGLDKIANCLSIAAGR